METKLFAELVAAVRRSIAVISDNLSYIRKELPDLAPPQELQEQVLSMCRDFEGALQDVDTELRNFDALPAQRSGREPGPTLDLIKNRLREEIERMDGLVMSLRKLPPGNHRVTGLEVMVNESAANILLAYMNIRENLAAMAARLKARTHL